MPANAQLLDLSGASWSPCSAWAQQEVSWAFPWDRSLPLFSRLTSWATGLFVLSPGGIPLFLCHMSGPHF